MAQDSEFSPLTGDAVLLGTRSDEFLGVADAIERAIASFRTVVDTSEMQSDAVSAVRESATKVADSIAPAQERYRATALALSTYSGELDEAQVSARAAITQIDSATEDYVAAQSRADTAQETAL